MIMTIDDAIIVLKWLHNNDYVSRFMIDEVKEATNIAIDALTTIEEIKKDINEIIYECDNSYHTNAHFTLALDGLLEKIDKHLKGENG